LEKVYQPNPENVIIYNNLFNIYKKLHDAFGVAGSKIELFSVMKDLIKIKNE